LGFLPFVFVCGLLNKGKFIKENLKKSRKYAFGVMLLGVFICYIFGACYYAAVYVNASFFEGIAVSIMTCVVPYLIPDMVKILITVFLWDKLRRVIKEV
jgi:biotin transporter BioY